MLEPSPLQPLPLDGGLWIVVCEWMSINLKFVFFVILFVFVFVFVFVTYVRQDHRDQRQASWVQSHRPPPQTPPLHPQKAPETRRSCTGDRFTRLFQLWILLARLTSSISYWWFVNGGKSVKCIRKLADEEISLSRCQKMRGCNKVCIFVLFPLREKFIIVVGKVWMLFPHGRLEHCVCGTLMNMYRIYSYQNMKILFII